VPKRPRLVAPPGHDGEGVGMPIDRKSYGLDDMPADLFARPGKDSMNVRRGGGRGSQEAIIDTTLAMPALQ
jgi:hypothetical protein